MLITASAKDFTPAKCKKWRVPGLKNAARTLGLPVSKRKNELCQEIYNKLSYHNTTVTFDTDTPPTEPETSQWDKIFYEGRLRKYEGRLQSAFQKAKDGDFRSAFSDMNKNKVFWENQLNRLLKDRYESLPEWRKELEQLEEKLDEWEKQLDQLEKNIK